MTYELTPDATPGASTFARVSRPPSRSELEPMVKTLQNFRPIKALGRLAPLQFAACTEVGRRAHDYHRPLALPRHRGASGSFEDPDLKTHPTAVVSPRAVVHSSVELGPFSVVEPEAVIGQGCKLSARSTVKSFT